MIGIYYKNDTFTGFFEGRDLENIRVAQQRGLLLLEDEGRFVEFDAIMKERNVGRLGACWPANLGHGEYWPANFSIEQSERAIQRGHLCICPQILEEIMGEEGYLNLNHGGPARLSLFDVNRLAKRHKRFYDSLKARR